MATSATTFEQMPIAELNKIVQQVWDEFDNRRTVWSNRRKVRFRQMDTELGALPLSQRAGGNRALMVYQTEEPNQEVHRRVKRLIANKERIEVITYASDDEVKEQAQDAKDALKALWKWMNRGKISPNRLSTTYQQGDGLGLLKLDLIIDYADSKLKYFDPEALEGEPDEDEDEEQTKARDSYLKTKQKYQEEDEEDLEAPTRAYKDVVHRALRQCDPPFRLSAPDPLTFAYSTDGDTIDVYVEKGTRSLSALLQSLQKHRVRLIDNRLVVFPELTEAISGTTKPALPRNMTLGKQFKDEVDYTEIRTKTEICIIMKQPKLRNAMEQAAKDKSKTAGEEGMIKVCFDNPFGPYSVGCALVPGDISGSLDHADDFQPSILGTLNIAQKINVLTTIRVSAAIDSALAPPYIEMKDDAAPPDQLNQNDTNKTKTVKDGDPIPMIPGKLSRMASANIDLDKAEARFMQEEALYRFTEVLAGDATSSDSGHKLAIQVSQADVQMVPYQNTRAEAIAEILMCCLYATKKVGKPIYVKEVPDTHDLLSGKPRMNYSIRALLPSMFDLMQDAALVVSIGSETPVTKFAKWSALQQRYEKGTLSFETLMEQTDVENVADEIARIFEGQTLVAVMQQAIPVVVKMIATRSIQRINGGPSATVGAGGNENGGGAPGAAASLPIASVGRVPGVGMNSAGPPEEAPGGPQPGGAELAPLGSPVGGPS